MATEPTPHQEQVNDERPTAALTITDSTGETVTLDEARRARLAADADL